MKSRLGVFTNRNALIVSFGLTHGDLKLAAKLNPNPLVIVDADDNEIFKLINSSCTDASPDGVSFPFKGAKTVKPEVLFTINGTDLDEIKFEAATIVSNLAKVESQCKIALKAMRKTADAIVMIEPATVE